MQKVRVTFVLFLILWLFTLNYLIMNRSTLNYPVLSKISEPFLLITGNVAGAVPHGNNIYILILFNVIIATLFSLSYFHWESTKSKKSVKKR